METFDLDELRAEIERDDYEPIGSIQSIAARDVVALLAPAFVRSN